MPHSFLWDDPTQRVRDYQINTENMTAAKNSFTPSDIPAEPGVYIFRDLFGNIIYVGKAVNLRKRMQHYFRPSAQRRADPRLRSLINSIASWEFHQVKSDDEALILESRLIKQYAPHYNILMRDDKRFLLIKINPEEPFPRLRLTRIRRNDSCRYFGPFPHGRALKSMLEFLNAYFRLRTCSAIHPSMADRKHCLKKSIKTCSAPCVKKISEMDYRQQVARMLELLEGNVTPLVAELEAKMKQAASGKCFEKAAKLRDVISNITWVFGSKPRSFRFATLPSPRRGAVAELGKLLQISPPKIIEGFDISNIFGTFAVGSMVRFEDGAPARSRYRRFRIRGVDQIDDFAMMGEIIRRRYQTKSNSAASVELPDLILVDGGKGQLTAAIQSLADSGYSSANIIGLAKKNEEIFVPDQSEPIVIEPSSAALKLLQAIRDEAHRFAIDYHRRLRDKKIAESQLDEMPGIGPERKKKLLREFGSVKQLTQTTAEEIVQRVPGIGQTFADKLVLFLQDKKL